MSLASRGSCLDHGMVPTASLSPTNWVQLWSKFTLWSTDQPRCIYPVYMCPCQPLLPASLYWYGGNRRCPGRVPQWVNRLLQDGPLDPVPEEDNLDTGDPEHSLSVPDDDPTENDQPIDVTPCYSLRDRSNIVPPAHDHSHELLPKGSDVTLLLTQTIRRYIIVVFCRPLHKD